MFATIITYTPHSLSHELGGFNISQIKPRVKHLVLMNSIAVKSGLGRAEGAEDKVRDTVFAGAGQMVGKWTGLLRSC